MPGPVSDSYDPEFSTGANADQVLVALREVREKMTAAIGSKELKPIVQVAAGKPGPAKGVVLSERDLRLLRFALDRAVESI